jgi:hypothetical protein
VLKRQELNLTKIQPSSMVARTLRNLSVRKVLALIVLMTVVVAVFAIAFMGLGIVFTFLLFELRLGTLEVLQLLSVLFALLLVLATTMSWRSGKELNRTMIRPRIFVRGSTRVEREEAYLRGQLEKSQVELPGIHLENIGLGPAIRGDITLIEEDGTKVPIKEGKRHSFDRIPPGWVYLYPSHFCPELGNHLMTKTSRHRQKLRLRVRYYDLQDTSYELRKEEQEIDLQEPQAVAPAPTIQLEIMKKLLDIMGELDSGTLKEFKKILTATNVRRLLEFLHSSHS